MLAPAANYGATGVPATATALGFTTGGTDDLDPERAKIFTAGMVFRPQSLPRFNVELGWFRIDYTERVVRPIPVLSQTLSDPIYAAFVTRNPSLAQQDALFALADSFTNNTGAAYDPANVIAIFDNRFTNVTRQKAHGFDLAIRYGLDFLDGHLGMSADAAWLDSERKLSDLSLYFPTSGAIYYPPKLRARAGLSWTRDGFTVASTLNRLGAVEDTRFTPNRPGESMTTLDLTLDYRIDLAGSGPAGPGELGLTLAVTNLFNDGPPLISPSAPFFINFDSTNYSGIGRMVSATVTMRF